MTLVQRYMDDDSRRSTSLVGAQVVAVLIVSISCVGQQTRGANSTIVAKTKQTGHCESPLLMPSRYEVTIEARGLRPCMHGEVVAPMDSRIQV